MAYEAYDRFLAAARQFPRWTNARRRPLESAGGKILRSIIEEIERVEDAIIEYKKDFFIKYYEGREDSILDYVYTAQVGDIEDLDAFTVDNPSYGVTDDEAEFYNDKTLALCKNGYVILYETNDDNRLQYTYNGYTYYSEITPQVLWNIFDEFAWWCGLERFPGEKNASLRQRCLSQFRTKPNSTEEGIRNAILNAARAKVDLLDEDKITVPALENEEIRFLEPNEETLSLLNDDGISLYEEISQFNRDIARTRKWDLDYWDNAFRQLKYLPHVWDADVDIYRDGVGYHDALKVATVKEIDQDSKTDLDIKGYVYSIGDVDAYIRKHNIQQDIALSLTKYKNEITPLPIQYRIEAEDLIPVSHPEQIYISGYKQQRNGIYDLEPFVKNWDGTIQKTAGGALKNDMRYRLDFALRPREGTMEIWKCDLVKNGAVTSLLQTKNDFVLEDGKVTNRTIAFHGNKVSDLYAPDNLQDMDDTGFRMIHPMEDASFKIDLKNYTVGRTQPLSFTVDPDSGWQDITSSLLYIKATDYTYNAQKNIYTSKKEAIGQDQFLLTFSKGTCRDLTFYIAPETETEDRVLVDIVVTVDGKRDSLESAIRLQVNGGFTYSFSRSMIDHNVTVSITRRSLKKVTIGRIRRTSYQFVLDHGVEATGTNAFQIPKLPANTFITCKIDNAGNPVSPVIRAVHVGAELTTTTYTLDPFVTDHTSSYSLAIESNCSVTLTNVTTGEVFRNYNTHAVYSGTGDIILDLSSFDTVQKTVPVSKKVNSYGENAYYIHLAEGSIQTIEIQGKGYVLDKRKTLAECVSVAAGETLYYARTFQSLLSRSNTSQHWIDITFPPADKICITSNDAAVQACFVVGNVDHIALEHIGRYNKFYLFDTTAKTYIAYNTEYLTKDHTEGIEIIPSFDPAPANMARLSYKISEIIQDQDVTVMFAGTDDTWSVQANDTLTIDIDTLKNENIANNVASFDVETTHIGHTVALSNVIDLDDFIDKNDIKDPLGTYIITPPDNMTVDYTQKTFSQEAYEDGGALYVEEDGFNKLYHSNIVRIDKIRIAGVTYDTPQKIGQICTLLPEEGILCWKNKTLAGRRIEWINYTYKEPTALRFKNINELYMLSGYQIKTQQSVNRSEYKVRNVTDGQKVILDPSYFSTAPDIIAVTCTNPCYYANVLDDTVYISKVAEDHTPVIHNGFYYADGKEYYFFANKYQVDINQWGGASFENGRILDHKLYLYQEAVNYLQNSKMECNKLDIHCIVDFSKPRARTNIDPLGHIGACESYTMWEDHNVNRMLTTYKNGYATQFMIADNGYSILDITPFLQNHTVISCLYTGHLTFTLAREIRIMGEQALQSVYCEPVDTFQTYQDIAYCIPDNVDLTQYRYYLVVNGTGVLDEVLIHDLTDPAAIAAHHVKAIDKLGLLVAEKNKTPDGYARIEYDSLFMRYNQLETDTDTTLRVGTTVDWNITKQRSYDLADCVKMNFLYRSGSLVSQKNGAVLETKPVAVRYRKSIYQAALKINQYLAEPFRHFTIYAYSSKTQDGTYTEIGKAENENIVTFPIRETDQYIKFRIVADESKIITDLDLFFIYKESFEEDLGVYYHTEGSAVTRVFNIGAVGTYRFNRVICEDGYDDYDQIWIRGAKKAPGGELVWTNWKNTETHPDFDGYELFQFKIVMKGQDAKLRIKEFEFKVF